MTRYAVSGVDRTAREWAANRLCLRARAILRDSAMVDWSVDPPELTLTPDLSATELAMLGTMSTAAGPVTAMAGVATTTAGQPHPDGPGHVSLGLSATHSHPYEPTGAVATHAQTPHGGTHPDLPAHQSLGLAGAIHNHDAAYIHSHPYAPTSHAHIDSDLPAGLARDAEVAAAYALIHSHPYEPSGTVAAHAAAADPHPVYLTATEGNAAYSILAHAHAPVHAALANGATAMAFGTNGSVKVTPTATATYTTTVPAAGTHVHLIVLTAGTTTFTITFGTGFKPTATLVTGATAARVFLLSWLSDGTNLYEVSRTAAMVA